VPPPRTAVDYLTGNRPASVTGAIVGRVNIGTSSKELQMASELVDRYLAAWNTADPTDRAGAVAAVFTPDATYTDPLASVGGHDAIAAVIAGARDMFPGHSFRPHGAPDAHHDLVRFGWELVPPGGGEPTVVGFDVAVLAADGRMRAVHGFLDKVPAGA
jgi:hypothetical protein